MKEQTLVEIQKLIDAYNLLVKGIESKANEDEDRAYGGIIRAGKGLLVENVAKKLIELTWNELGTSKERLSLKKQTVKIPLNPQYLHKIKRKEIRNYIEENIKEFYYTLKTDVHVYVDNQFAIGIECKAYTENAMLKRILVDFTLFKSVFPNLNCVLFQLESQLGGDYSQISKDITFGSPSTHTLMSYFDVDLHIITMLEGERKVDKPIHKEEHFKELSIKSVIKAVELFKEMLKKYV